MHRFVCLLISLTAFSWSVIGQKPIVPRFEAAPCAIEVPSGEDPLCGYLVVRENRTTHSDRTIKLPVVTLKSRSPHPKPDSVLRTLGGPGASSLGLIRGRKASPWL